MWLLNAKNGAQTKRPKTKRLWKKRPAGQNVRRDKTSGGTKRPAGQNVRTDKTSGGQNVQRDKTSGGQNVHLGHV
jgi:hypothetical protein